MQWSYQRFLNVLYCWRTLGKGLEAEQIYNRRIVQYKQYNMMINDDDKSIDHYKSIADDLMSFQAQEKNSLVGQVS